MVSWALFGFTTNHEIRLYRINANNGSLTPIGTRLLLLTAASGLDFSPDGKFSAMKHSTALVLAHRSVPLRKQDENCG